MSDDVYSLYGSSLKDSSQPTSSSYSPNVGEVKPSKNDIERRKKEAAEDVNPVRVGQTANQIVESMGKVEPPLGEAIAGTGKNLAENLSPYLIAPPVLYGLYKAWQNYDNNNPPNTPPNNPPNNPPNGPTQPQSKFTPPQGDVIDVASRPVGEPRMQIGGPKSLPAAEAAAPAFVAEAPAAPPVSTEATPVQPKPIDPYQQAKIDKIAAETALINQRAAQEAERHKQTLAKDAERAVKSQQKSQGQPKNGLSNDANALVANAAEGKVKADLTASLGVKPVNPMPIGGTNAPMPPNAMPVGEPPVATAPVVTAPTAPVVPSPEKVAAADKLTKEQKGMKNYLVSQYGGGPEGEAAYKKVIDILGEVPAYEKGQGGGLTPEANNAIKEWRKTNIEGPKVNLTHDMKKVMKGAGGAAVLMALPGFAEAAQRKDMGKMSDIFTDFFVLPFAQSREAGMPKAQEEDIIAAKFKEASKLGSPYRSVPPPRK